jgi:hypothetical protein
VACPAILGDITPMGTTKASNFIHIDIDRRETKIAGRK